MGVGALEKEVEPWILVRAFRRRGRAMYGGELLSRDRVCVDAETPGARRPDLAGAGFPLWGPSLSLGAWLTRGVASKADRSRPPG